MTFVRLAREEHVATVTLARPEALNAISTDVADELAGAFLQTAADPSVWAVILAAEGAKAFCVGADLKERNQLDDAGWMRNRVFMRAMFESIRSAPQPTIASVFGYALGGGFELALSCDFIVTADDAILGLPETRVGIVPGGGGTQLLGRRVGISRAKRIVLAGERIGAEEGHDIGLVDRVVERTALPAATEELARQIVANSPVGVREAKSAIERGWSLSMEDAIQLEELAWLRAVASEDRREGIAAFNEKRAPRWSGR